MLPTVFKNQSRHFQFFNDDLNRSRGSSMCSTECDVLTAPGTTFPTPEFSPLPQSLKSPPGNTRVVHRVFRVAMSEIVLHRSEIDTGVGEIVAARVAQHVR